MLCSWRYYYFNHLTYLSDFQKEFYCSRDRLQAFLSGYFPKAGAKSPAQGIAFNARQLITEMLLQEEKDLTSNQTKTTYTLPDGSVLDISSERFCAPEIYFNPVPFYLLISFLLTSAGPDWVRRVWTSSIYF